MEPVEELVQVRVPPRTVEVRVHGVSGTPPQALLSAFPMRVEGDANAGFYRARQADAEAGIAEAFSWGGLTSRSRVTALWLFLAPLALINVAGWMTPSPSRASQRGSAYQVRRVAMRLVTVAATVLASAIAVQAAATVLGLVTADAPVATLAAVTSVGLAALVPLGLHLLSKVGGAPDDHEDHEDVFGRAHSLHGLSAGHLGIGLSTVALLGGIVAGADPLGPVAGIGILVAMVGLALGTAAALQTRTSGPDVEPPEGRRAVVAGVAALVMVGAGLALDGAGVFPVQSHGDPDGALTVRPEALTVAHFTIAGTAAVLLAVALLAERRMPVRESAGHSVAFAALGFFMSYSAFGALSYGLLGLASEGSPQAFLEDPEPAIMFRFIDYSAVVLTCAALWVAARIAGEVRPLAPAGEHGVDAARRLRAAVNGATGDLRRAGTGLLIAALVLVLAELLRLAFEGATWAERLASVLTEPRMVLGAVGWLFVAYLVVRVCRGRRGALAIAAVGIAAVGALVWLVDQGGVDLLAWARLDTDLPGTAGIDHPSVPATAFTMGAVVLALFVPAASVLYFVFSASGNRESRRGVGVLWDLTNFWPRLYHPWAPTPY
ncbi:hypothetical protein, partial [uncultured Demequina sp.]|uniref:hypothetical protein n=1 Tax=uncultured Demequina sp. TaxID=693499 RepID=UPI0025F84895